MGTTALIIFVRDPVLGKVKTRIAATMGNEEALAVYGFLLGHTRSIVDPIPAQKFIFYSDGINHDDLWNGYKKGMQTGNDLGERMANAFATISALGYTKICIIGSDCYELTTDILHLAFDSLGPYNAVVGPASDGGYYLLGMYGEVYDLFGAVPWSTRSVYAETLKKMAALSLSWWALPMLTDVDEEKDITFPYKTIDA